MRPTTLRPLRALLALALLAIAGWILHRSGGADGSRTVPLGSFADFQRWADDTPTSLMAAAVARLGGLIAVVYLGGVVAVALVADALRCKVLARAALAATPAAFRRLLGGGVARVGLVAGTVLAPTMAATSASATPVEEPEQPTATMTRSDGDQPELATMVWLGPESPDPEATRTPTPTPTETPTPSPSPTATPTPTPATSDATPVPAATTPGTVPAPVPTPSVPSPAAATRPAETRVVEPGDSFWSIAEEEAHREDVPQYWQALITANRDRLVAPECPDLLIPGQTLVLPAP